MASALLACFGLGAWVAIAALTAWKARWLRSAPCSPAASDGALVRAGRQGAIAIRAPGSIGPCAGPWNESLDLSLAKITGLWAIWSAIACLYCIARWYWSGNYLFAMQVLGIGALPLLLLSIPYVLWLDRRLVEPRDGAWHFGRMIIGRATEWIARSCTISCAPGR
jgi:hypothetical protein